MSQLLSYWKNENLLPSYLVNSFGNRLHGSVLLQLQILPIYPLLNWDYLCILFKLWKKWKYNGSWKCKVQLHLFQVFNIQRNVENILDISLSYTLEVQCNSRKMITQAFTTDNISEIGGLSIGVLLGWDITNFLLEHLKQSLCSFWKNMTGRETWMWSHHPFAEDHLLYGLRAEVFPELFCQHNIWHCRCSRLWIVI